MLDLEYGMLRVSIIIATKGAFVAFLRPEFLNWVKNNYLPHRESCVERIGRVGMRATCLART
ncbi:MAG: hypothetical protein NO076_03965 [Sulfolobales archaeon]|nr:hypothetical protein [Sulfolobales archaeon]